MPCSMAGGPKGLTAQRFKLLCCSMLNIRAECGHWKEYRNAAAFLYLQVLLHPFLSADTTSRRHKRNAFRRMTASLSGEHCFGQRLLLYINVYVESGSREALF